jgi:tetratricopeptide (TPR) repeat protein
LDISGTADEKEDVKQLVKQHLSNKAVGKWLLIIDNADDTNLVFGTGKLEGIADFLPQSENGLILFTTRYQEVAVLLECRDIIEVEEMTQKEAISFLKNCLAQNSHARKQMLNNDTAAIELLEELTYLPLAIAQAAAYLNRNKTLSISGYLRLLQNTEQDFISLLSHEFRDSTRYHDKKTANAVAKTWLVSFDQIRAHDTIAAGLLSFISCIEPKAIPRSILPAVQPEERMIRAIGTLCGYSFLAKRGDVEMYDTHRLVHVAIGIWVEQCGSSADTVKEAIQHVSEVFPYAMYSNQAICREYLTHALQLLQGKLGENLEEKYTLAFKVGQFLYNEGRIQEAVRWFEASHQWMRNNLVDDHPSRLASQHELASAYQADGQIKKAVNLLEHVVTVESRVLAEDHPNQLASQHALSVAYQADGQIKKAVNLLELVVAVESRVLAEDHPDQLASQHALSVAYQADGQIKKAVNLLELVVTVQSQVLAEDHPSRLASQHELSIAYRADGQIKKAVDLLEHVVIVQSQVLAEDHPSRLASQHELASAYEADGQVKKAGSLLEYVVTVRSQVLAEDHPSRLASQHALSVAYRVDGQIKKAVDLLEHVVAVRSKTLWPDHFDRLNSENALKDLLKTNQRGLKNVDTRISFRKKIRRLFRNWHGRSAL